MRRFSPGAPGTIAILGVSVYDPHHGFDDADVAAAESAAGTAPFRLLIAHSPFFICSGGSSKSSCAALTP